MRADLSEIGHWQPRFDALIGKDIQAGLKSMSADLCEALGSERLTLYAIDKDRQVLTALIQTGLENFGAIRLPVSAASIAGFAALSRRLLNIRDVYDQEELRAIDPEVRLMQEIDKRAGIVSRQMLVCPVMALDMQAVLGVIQAVNSRAAAFDDAAQRLVRDFAAALATPLQAHATTPEANQMDTETESDNALIAAIDKLMLDAIVREATEVHLDKVADGVLVRYRGADGLLHERQRLSFAHNTMLARIKILADLDISERRLPQQNQVRMKIGDALIEAAVATLPTLRGERVILRLRLDRAEAPSLAENGAADALIAAVRASLGERSGLIVAGSAPADRGGMLRSLLREVDAGRRLAVLVTDNRALPPDERIVTVEPLRQTGVAGSLRALARHSPDLVFLDRALEAEELALAIALAKSGAMVIIWAPAASPIEGLAYLASQGVRNEESADLLSLVLTEQRHARLCPRCRQRAGSVWEAKGCDWCIGGRKGEACVYRALALGDSLRRLLREGQLEHASFQEEEQRLSGHYEEGLRELVKAGEIAGDVLLKTR